MRRGSRTAARQARNRWRNLTARRDFAGLHGTLFPRFRKTVVRGSFGKGPARMSAFFVNTASRASWRFPPMRLQIYRQTHRTRAVLRSSHFGISLFLAAASEVARYGCDAALAMPRLRVTVFARHRVRLLFPFFLQSPLFSKSRLPSPERYLPMFLKLTSKAGKPIA